MNIDAYNNIIKDLKDDASNVKDIFDKIKLQVVADTEESEKVLAELSEVKDAYRKEQIDHLHDLNSITGKTSQDDPEQNNEAQIENEIETLLKGE